MECPTCGQEATFTNHAAGATEPHGEYHYDEWLVCDSCGAETTDAELAKLAIVAERRAQETEAA